MLLFSCRKCGLQAPSLEGHKCVAAAPNRLEVARAALAEVEERKAVTPKKPVAVPAEMAATLAKDGFDRNAYHKAYMKTYMQAYRRRAAAKATS